MSMDPLLCLLCILAVAAMGYSACHTAITFVRDWSTSAAATSYTTTTDTKDTAAAGTPASTATDATPQQTKTRTDWRKLPRDRRIQAEVKRVKKLVTSGQLGCVKSIEGVGDSLSTWRIKLNDFDNDSPGGKMLNKDLQKLAAR